MTDRVSAKISVIVPVYNVENYVERCIDSILDQTYKNFELIIIDDGSTDGSGSIVDRYVDTDPRVTVIHVQNKGAAAARNLGINKAQGEYISFVDSDDWIENTFLDRLSQLIEKNDADIAWCGYTKVSDSEKHGPDQKSEDLIVENGIDAIDNLYGKGYLNYVVVWNKIYKSSLFEDIRFVEGMIYEDEIIVADLYFKASKVVGTPVSMYNYRVDNEKSVMSQKYSLKRLEILKALEIRMSRYSERGLTKYYEKDSFKYLYKILLNIVEIKKLGPDKKQTVSDLRKKYWGKYREALRFDWTMKRKIGMFFFGLFPKAYLLRYKKN